jgi:hypothetical protein
VKREKEIGKQDQEVRDFESTSKTRRKENEREERNKQEGHKV